jgi:hypothetical protein
MVPRGRLSVQTLTPEPWMQAMTEGPKWNLKPQAESHLQKMAREMFEED